MKFRIITNENNHYVVQRKFIIFWLELSEHKIGTLGKNWWDTLEWAEEFIKKYSIHKSKKRSRVVKIMEVDKKDVITWILKGEDNSEDK